MKEILTFIILLGIFSCDINEPKKLEDYSLEEQIEIRKISDGYIDKAKEKNAMDSTGQSNSPIKVLKYRLISHNEYSNYKDIELTFKNISDKKIVGIKFHWYCKNVFGEVADNGDSGGFTDKSISPNKTMTLQWEMLSKDAKKIKNVKVIEVVFEDETKWTN
jgi:hypothetical protein